MIKLSVGGAIASLLGKTEHPDYQDVGYKLKVKELATVLGLTATPMLYHYMNGKTKTMEAERVLIIAKRFNILISDWGSIEEVEVDCASRDKASDMLKSTTNPILEEIIEIEKLQDLVDIKQALRRIIVRYY